MLRIGAKKLILERHPKARRILFKRVERRIILGSFSIKALATEAILSVLNWEKLKFSVIIYTCGDVGGNGMFSW